MRYGQSTWVSLFFLSELLISRISDNSIKRIGLLFWTVLFCCGLAPATVLAQSELARVTQTWTGLEKFRGQLSVVKLVIQAAETVEQITPRQRVRLALPPEGGLPITGTISHQAALPGRRGGLAAAAQEEITGDYFPAVNLLRFRIDGPWSSGSTMFAVLNESYSEMGLVYTGAGRNNLPYLLAAGEDFPAEVEKFVPGAPNGIVAQRALAQAAVDGQTDFLQAAQALSLEVGRAAAAGDQQRIIQLQQEIQQLQQQNAQQQREQLLNQTASGGGTLQQQVRAAMMKVQEATQSGDPAAILAAQQEYQQVLMAGLGTAPSAATQVQGCPDNIVSWAKHMDSQGASFVEFTGSIQVSNLFRPGVFRQFFSTTFADMPAAEKSNIAYSLQRACTVRGSEFYSSGNATSLMSAFAETGGYAMADAGIASLALEHIASWVDATLNGLENSGSWEHAKQMEALYQPLLTAIWPVEAQVAEAGLVNVKNILGLDALTQQLNLTVGRVNTEGAPALRDMVGLRRGPVYLELDQASKNRFDQALNEQADSVLTAYINAAGESSVSNSSIAALAANRNWYASHADIFTALADLPVVSQYHANLGRLREAAFAELQQQLQGQLADLDSWVEVAGYGGDFVLALDSQYSPSWQLVEQRRAERLVEVEREIHVARVGEGPFDPDHPGAVYLNAIYRNDLGMIREEDSAYAQPFRTFMDPISESGFFELVPFFTGGLFSAQDMQGYLESEIDNMTILDTLAGFFVVSYQYAFAMCMDPVPIEIERTVFWDVVTTDGWGNELWRTTESETYNYTLNRRHVNVFNEVGTGQDPEQAEMVSSMFGAFLPQSLKTSYSKLSNALRGLRMGMQQFACDSPDMQQFERNLIALALQ